MAHKVAWNWSLGSLHFGCPTATCLQSTSSDDQAAPVTPPPPFLHSPAATPSSSNLQSARGIALSLARIHTETQRERGRGRKGARFLFSSFFFKLKVCVLALARFMFSCLRLQNCCRKFFVQHHGTHTHAERDAER